MKQVHSENYIFDAHAFVNHKDKIFMRKSASVKTYPLLKTVASGFPSASLASVPAFQAACPY